MRAILIVLFAWSCAAAGCHRDEASKEAKPPEKALGEATDAARDDVATVRALFETWVSSQVKRDFLSYKGLYAERFRGERVSGKTLRSYERVAWLDERRQIMRVETGLQVDNVRFTKAPNAVHVEFDETFTNFEFNERASKLLIFVKERGQYKIAFEHPYLPEPEPPKGAKPEAYFVVHIDAKQYVVLESRADRRWGSGVAYSSGLLGPILPATQPVGSALPEEKKALSGMPLSLVSMRGERCEVTVGSLALLTAVEPPWEELQALTGKVGPALTPAQLGGTIFEIARPEDILLVGEVQGCDGSFALPPSTKLALHEPQGPLELPLSKVGKAVSGSAAARDLQESFLRFYGGSPLRADWYTRHNAYGFIGQPDLAVIELRGAGDTPDWYGGLTALVRGVQSGALTTLGTSPFVNPPSLLLDLGADGSWEILTRPGEMFGDLVRVDMRGGQVLAKLRFSEYGCGC